MREELLASKLLHAEQLKQVEERVRKEQADQLDLLKAQMVALQNQLQSTSGAKDSAEQKAKKRKRKADKLDVERQVAEAVKAEQEKAVIEKKKNDETSTTAALLLYERLLQATLDRVTDSHQQANLNHNQLMTNMVLNAGGDQKMQMFSNYMQHNASPGYAQRPRAEPANPALTCAPVFDAKAKAAAAQSSDAAVADADDGSDIDE